MLFTINYYDYKLIKLKILIRENHQYISADSYTLEPFLTNMLAIFNLPAALITSGALLWYRIRP